MHNTHIWDLFHLHWKKIILAGLILWITTLQESAAQGLGYKRRHLEHYDDKPVHYGFHFSLPVSRYRFTHADNFNNPDVPYLIQSPASTGFRMGLAANLSMTEHWDLRFTPSVSLYNRELHLSYLNNETRKLKRESTWVELPLLFKYKSKRRINSRMYMIAGATLGLETNVRRKGRTIGNELHANSKDFSIDYGFGFEQFFEFFKLAPELRFSHGLVNLLPSGPESTANGLSKFTSHTVTLYLNFE